MRDYVKSRPAKVGEKLRTQHFHPGTVGFAAPEDAIIPPSFTPRPLGSRKSGLRPSRDHPGLQLGNGPHLLQQEFARCAFIIGRSANRTSTPAHEDWSGPGHWSFVPKVLVIGNNLRSRSAKRKHGSQAPFVGHQAVPTKNDRERVPVYGGRGGERAQRLSRLTTPAPQSSSASRVNPECQHRKRDHLQLRSRCTKAAVHRFQIEAVAEPKNPMVGSFAGCCARAASGHAAAALPTNAMNSRRFN
jgi:hypothetical protein